MSDELPAAGTEAQPKAVLHFLDNLLLVHARGDENGGHFGLIEFLGPPGDQAPPHVHHDHDEGFYVTEGEVTLYFPDREVVLQPGEYLCTPKGVAHTYKVTSPTNARWLIMSIPGGFEKFVEDYGEPADDLDLPEHTEPDVERLIALGEKQNIEVLGPMGMLPKDLANR